MHCFANRCSLDESSNSIDETFFLKKIEVTSIYVFKKVVEKYASTRHLLSSKEVIDIFQIFDNNWNFYRYSAIRTFTSERYNCCRSGHMSYICLICLNSVIVLDIWYHIPGLNEINFCDINFDVDFRRLQNLDFSLRLSFAIRKICF